ncbi:hypothetical protein PCANB_001803 [Pneumocystis canis]|nr:hypothetical protein PCK1_002219 [Pneumocystis canis]KAG5440233.1 hypothetical protein PCANB_001803 [Pneumocystis canis]
MMNGFSCDTPDRLHLAIPSLPRSPVTLPSISDLSLGPFARRSPNPSTNELLPPISSFFDPPLSAPLACHLPPAMHGLLPSQNSYMQRSTQNTKRPAASYDHYACPQCFKTFSRPSNLKVHSYSHTGERPFVCLARDCGRSFSVRSNMRRHMRVHGL